MAHPPGSNNIEKTKRTRIASNKVRDPTNDAELELPSHREARTQAQHVDGDDNHGNAITNIGSSCESTEVPGPSKRPRFASPSTSPEPELKKPTLSAKEKTRDINEFFEEPETVSGKKSRRCKFCKKKQLTKVVVNEATTLRRHIESFHKPAYDKWCGLNTFKSKLPKVVRMRREAAIAEDRARQQSLDPI
ncbi:hypothetical protein EDB85DRAFT_1903419 [Lactarius pseudohatsudake]|nr:hypothetical protein EDB85DRAFT_1903419 [Lactarius pseudohatsudake]